MKLVKLYFAILIFLTISIDIFGQNTNRPPDIRYPSDNQFMYIGEGIEISFQVNASDVDSGDVVALSLLSGPGSLTSTGEYKWTPTSSDINTNTGHSVTIRASDGKGGNTDRTFKIFVNKAEFSLDTYNSNH